MLRVPDIGGVQPVYRNFRRVAHGRCERSAKDARSNRENAVRRTSTIGDKPLTKSMPNPGLKTNVSATPAVAIIVTPVATLIVKAWVAIPPLESSAPAVTLGRGIVSVQKVGSPIRRLAIRLWSCISTK